MPVNALDAILQLAWAIEPRALDILLQVAQREGPGPEAVATQLGRKLDNTRAVTMRDGVAVVPIVGPIFRRGNMFTQVSGATSIDLLARDLNEAASNEAVRAILLDIDSPGGQATGISEMAGLIGSMRKVKPVHAYVGGCGASAAYWLAAAAETITVAPTAIVGSIGVLAAYRRPDASEITIVSSLSPKKHVDPGTEEGAAQLRGTIDALAEVFVSDVARYRGVSTQCVLSDFGQGGTLVGKAAVKAGMVDRLGTLEGTLRRLKSPAGMARRGAAADAGADLDAQLAEDHEYVPAPTAGTFETQIEAALTAVGVCIERARELRALREEQGRAPFSVARREQLAGLEETLRAFLRETEPRVSRADRRRLEIESLRLEAGLIRLPARSI